MLSFSTILTVYGDGTDTESGVTILDAPGLSVT